MGIEELMDLQEQGSKARNAGLSLHENPYLKPEHMPSYDTGALGDWLARHDAWKFGWEAEDASRAGGIVEHFKALLQYPPEPADRPRGLFPHIRATLFGGDERVGG